jgi:lysophospholipase L1-like esterase
MGLGGDCTQHVLWRLDNGEIAGISPKLAVIMIGINNLYTSDNTAKEIGEGIIAICQKLRKELPNTKILILGTFPHGEKPSSQREKTAEASKLASTIADNKWIYYMDISDKFLDKDGTLSKDIMPDYVHPNTKGYQIEAEAIEPMVQKLMGEKK